MSKAKTKTTTKTTTRTKAKTPATKTAASAKTAKTKVETAPAEDTLNEVPVSEESEASEAVSLNGSAPEENQDDTHQRVYRRREKPAFVGISHFADVQRFHRTRLGFFGA